MAQESTNRCHIHVGAVSATPWTEKGGNTVGRSCYAMEVLRASGGGQAYDILWHALDMSGRINRAFGRGGTARSGASADRSLSSQLG